MISCQSAQAEALSANPVAIQAELRSARCKLLVANALPGRSENHRHGGGRKRLVIENGAVEIEVPRDRSG
jgi:hypothetical protein